VIKLKKWFKKTACVTICASMLFTFSGCGDKKTIDSKTYDTYGLLSQNDVKDPGIEYELVVGNLIWGIILIETIICPIYFWGYSLWEPVGKK
jgi:hypothetical protein